MAISFNNTSSGNSNDTPLTFSHTVNSGSDRILVVGICIEQGAGALPTVTSVTFDGTGLTQISTLVYKTDTNRVDLWYLLNPPVKTANVVVTLSGNLSDPCGLCAGAITINGAKQQAPEANNSNSGNGAAASVNISTITDSAWVIDVVSNNKSTYDQVAEENQTERYEEANDQRLNGSTKPVTSAGATSMSWTISDVAYWGMIAASFEQAAGGVTEWLAGISAGVAAVSGITKVLKKIAGLSAGAGMVIDVGAAAIDRYIWLGDDTIVNKENPANASGKIKHIEIYMNQAASVVVEVASFYVVSGNNLSTRASSGNLTVQTGFNEFNAPEDFAPFDIHKGDHIGLYVSSGRIEFDITGGEGVWYLFGDYIPCENQTFNLHATHTISLYARVAVVSGLLKVAKSIAGTISGIATVTGDIIVGLFLSGIANGIAAVNGIVKISKTIKGTVPGIATVVGSLTQFWEGWKKKQKSTTTWQKKDKGSTTWEKKSKPSTSWSKK